MAHYSDIPGHHSDNPSSLQVHTPLHHQTLVDKQLIKKLEKKVILEMNNKHVYALNWKIDKTVTQ